MLKRIAIKNYVLEIQLVTHRCIAALILMILLICLLVFRLAHLQLSQHEVYTTLSKKNWMDLVPIEPKRGLLYDRNGVLLAENIPVFSLDIIPSKVKALTKTLAEISKIIPLPDTDIAQFQKQLKQHRRFDEIPLKLRLTEQEVAKFYENQYRFPGVIVKARLLRHYPLGASFSHVLGYVGRINVDELNEIDSTNYSATNYIGKLGIEKYYEDELHGTVGYEQAENDARGEAIRVLNRINPTPGKNLYLTIDSKLQAAAEEALAGSRGAIVAIDPNNGQILALVSEPSFDPNLFVTGISNEDFQALQKSPDQPLYNRALRGLYSLGSTIKPFMALGGLDYGVTSAYDTIYDDGLYQLVSGGRVFHDWKKLGHGRVNISRAIMVSCDTYFFDLAHKLGIRRMGSTLDNFGFGKLTGIDLDEELPGNVPTPEWKRKVKGAPWYEGDTLVAGIGQGYIQVTPLQLATALSIVATHGKHYTPYLLLKEQEGNTLHTSQPTPINVVTLHDDNYWSVVIKAMQDVILSREGTANLPFGIAPYTVAGKTGTAQVYGKKREEEYYHKDENDIPERLRNHSLFIAFAPVDKPKIAVAVVVENKHLAVNIARKILDYYLVPPPPPPLFSRIRINGNNNAIH